MDISMRGLEPASPLRTAPAAARYPIARLFHRGSMMLLHPIVTLPTLVYLLSGSPGQIAWYAIVAGVAAALAGPSGALVAMLPGTTRVALAVLLMIQVAGVVVASGAALVANDIADSTLLRSSAIAYALIALPAFIIARLSEQGYEFRESSSASLVGVVPAIVGTILASLVVWRVFDSGSMGADDLLGRLLAAGALFGAAGSWLASWPTLLAQHLPHPARPMPRVRSPRLTSNRALQRYALFHAIRGVSRFAEPFLLVGVVTAMTPNLAWLGGAAFAYATGVGVASIGSIEAFSNVNIRGLFTVSGTLHSIAILLIAFSGEIFASSIIADRDPSQTWMNWVTIVAAAALGMSHETARTGHYAYVQSISSPATRDLSLTAIGVVMLITALAPLIGVRILESQDLELLLQIGAGASIIALLTTGLVVPTYASPRRPRTAWAMRR